MITCDECRKWLCMICTKLTDEQMETAAKETKAYKITKEIPGLKWLCEVCWKNIVKTEKKYKTK